MIPATATLTAAATSHWLLLQAGGAWLGLPASSVQEVRPATRWLPLPAVPEYVCGLINWRGSPLPVLDISSALGLGSIRKAQEAGDDRFEEQRVAVVRAGEFVVGVLADRMFGVIEAAAGTVSEPKVLTHGRLRDFSSGEVDGPRGMVALLDLARLLEATRLGGDG